MRNDNPLLDQQPGDHLKRRLGQQLSGQRLFVIDDFYGANQDSRLRVPFVTEVAWQAHFVKNMFILPSAEELRDFKPDFVVLKGEKCTNPDWREQDLHSESFVEFNLTEGIQLMGGGPGTASSILKGLLRQNHPPFARGWSRRSIRRFAVTRCWKIWWCGRTVAWITLMEEKPKTLACPIPSIISIISLNWCRAPDTLWRHLFDGGCLRRTAPVATLSIEQAQYHFLSRFTAKLAGTERGMVVPLPTFSTCFCAAFLSLNPTAYADVLAKRMHVAGAYLVNSGWDSSGKQISLKDTGRLSTPYCAAISTMRQPPPCRFSIYRSQPHCRAWTERYAIRVLLTPALTNGGSKRTIWPSASSIISVSITDTPVGWRW